MREYSTPVGIDLGTTYSALAVVDEHGRPVLLPNEEGERLTPSAVLFDGEDILVGSVAKRSAVIDSDRVALFVKRQMGDPDFYFEAGGRRYSAAELSAEILKKLKADAERRLGRAITDAVITVPAYFADKHRQATKQAGELAGLRVRRLLNEPTAAALAFGLHRAGREQHVLVYDLGGGTFDVTVMHFAGVEGRVVATDGDVHLGGKDWDDRLVHHVAEKFLRTHGLDPRLEPAHYQDLLERAEQAKKDLTQRLTTVLNCNYAGRALRVEVSRETFEALTADLLEQTMTTADLVLQAAGLAWADVGTVVLSGGSTRMPMVGRRLRERSGREPATGVDPDECVALGAALQAALRAEEEAPRSRPAGTVSGLAFIQDVTAHSLGTLARREGRRVNSKIIERNAPIPCERTRADYVTEAHHQTILCVPVLQGEPDEPDLCEFLAFYEFSGVPPRPAGESPIEVTFRYNSDGMVEVSARDVKSGKVLPGQRQAGQLSEFLGEPGAAGVDALFLFDTTGSMYPYLEEVRRHLADLVREIHAEVPTARTAIMAFGDHCDEGKTYLVKGCDFTSDADRLVEFIRAVEKTDGGDTPEAIEDALFEANRLAWGQEREKALVLIGDAPAHPVADCPYRRDYRAEAQQLMERNVRLYTVLCGSNAEARALFEWLAQRSGGKFLRLENMQDISDLLVAIALKEGGKLESFRDKLLAEQRLTESKRVLLQMLES
jgi:molecular chaperone DnaK